MVAVTMPLIMLIGTSDVTDDPETTGDEQVDGRFRSGQSGNPAGRPKGSRNKLGEEFVAALQADFTEHGKTAIAKVRDERPDQYLKVIASILPKDVNITVNDFEDKSDDELRRELQQLAALIQPFLAAEGDQGEDEGTRAETLN